MIYLNLIVPAVGVDGIERKMMMFDGAFETKKHAVDERRKRLFAAAAVAAALHPLQYLVSPL